MDEKDKLLEEYRRCQQDIVYFYEKYWQVEGEKPQLTWWQKDEVRALANREKQPGLHLAGTGGEHKGLHEWMKVFNPPPVVPSWQTPESMAKGFFIPAQQPEDKMLTIEHQGQKLYMKQSEWEKTLFMNSRSYGKEATWKQYLEQVKVTEHDIGNGNTLTTFDPVARTYDHTKVKKEAEGQKKKRLGGNNRKKKKRR
jgi:hypothetical protein